MTRDTLWNFVQFQAGWFALVFAVAWGNAWLGVAILTVLVAVHLGWFARRNEWQLLLLVGFGGWLWESCVHSLGLLRYPDHSPELMMAPLWMAALWVNFATALNHSLAWLKDQLFIAALLGSAGGPLAFLAGAKLGAVIYVDPVWTTLLLVAAWGILTPLLVRLARHIDTAGREVIGSALENSR